MNQVNFVNICSHIQACLDQKNEDSAKKDLVFLVSALHSIITCSS